MGQGERGGSRAKNEEEKVEVGKVWCFIGIEILNDGSLGCYLLFLMLQNIYCGACSLPLRAILTIMK